MKETDVYYPKDHNRIQTATGDYAVKDYAALLEVQEAEVLARYQEGFYQNEAAVTSHSFGQGTAYFIAPRTEQAFLDEFYEARVEDLHLANPLVVAGNPEVSIQSRKQAGRNYHFVMNFSETVQEVTLAQELHDLLTDETVPNAVQLQPYQVRVLVAE